MGLQWPTWTGHKCHKCRMAGMGSDPHPPQNSIAWRQKCHEYSYIAQVSNEYSHLNHFESIFHGCFRVVSGSTAAPGCHLSIPFHTFPPYFGGFSEDFKWWMLEADKMSSVKALMPWRPGSPWPRLGSTWQGAQLVDLEISGPNGPKKIGKRKRMGKMMRTAGLLGLFSGKLIYIYICFMWNKVHGNWKRQSCFSMWYDMPSEGSSESNRMKLDPFSCARDFQSKLWSRKDTLLHRKELLGLTFDDPGRLRNTLFGSLSKDSLRPSHHGSPRFEVGVA